MTKMTLSTELLLQRALACQVAALRELVALMVPWIQVRLVRRQLEGLKSLPDQPRPKHTSSEQASPEQARPDATVSDEKRRQLEENTRDILRHLFDDNARRLRDFQADGHPSLQHFVTQIAEDWSIQQNFCQNSSVESE